MSFVRVSRGIKKTVRTYVVRFFTERVTGLLERCLQIMPNATWSTIPALFHPNHSYFRYLPFFALLLTEKKENYPAPLPARFLVSAAMESVPPYFLCPLVAPKSVGKNCVTHQTE